MTRALGAMIHMGPVTSRISGQYPLQALYDHLSYRPQGYEHSQKFQRHVAIGRLRDRIRRYPDKAREFEGQIRALQAQGGVWDGYRRLLNRRGEFATGLLNQVLDLLDARQIPWTVEKSQYPEPWPPHAYGDLNIQLRPYQFEAGNIGFEERRGIIQVPTGGGKTEIAAYIIARAGQPSLFIVPTRDLMYQAIDRFTARLGIPIGQLGDGVYRQGRVVVATMQSAAKIVGAKFEPTDDESDWSDEPPIDFTARDFIRSAGAILVDEAQHASCETMREIFKHAQRVCWLIGLSATPWRDDGDDLLMEGVISNKIYEISASNLIDQGYLVPPDIHVLTVPRSPTASDANYAALYRDQLVENDARNLGIATLARGAAPYLLTLILVKQIKHGEALRRLLRHDGAVFLSGKDPGQFRHDVLDQCREGAHKILIATTLADEGLDLPNIGTVILAGGGKASGRALQRVGRALRPFVKHHVTKRQAVVYDLRDDWPVFQDHAFARISAYRQEPAFVVREEDWTRLVSGATAPR